MYERVTKLLEAELLRSNSEEQYSLANEQKDILSFSPSAPMTRPETTHSERILLESTPKHGEKT